MNHLQEDEFLNIAFVSNPFIFFLRKQCMQFQHKNIYRAPTMYKA